MITPTVALLSRFISFDPFKPSLREPLAVERDSLIALLALQALMAVIYGVWNLRARTSLAGIRAGIGALTPLMMLAVAYRVPAAVGNHLAIVVLAKNPLWSETSIGPTPIWNLLLLAYGRPTLLLFISLEIRHLWQGALSINLPTDNPELYTYSAVWLLISAVGMILAIRRRNPSLYRGAMALLILVIVKIFMVDMSGLDGLLRVASFMGLGLVLLLPAWLHQQLHSKQAPG